MKTAEIRQAFIEYFQKQQHTSVPSSALVPGNDPTLLFTNAGMVQFKDVFLGREKRDYRRAVSVQRCVRAGGKHNDLENVGYTARHHTFFEMLGNFSFGDYFKIDAIRFAWEFVTQTLKLPPEKLWITVYKDDDEAADIWLNQMGVSKDRFSRCDADNFWSMGDTGPCGPSTEIFYDHGPDIAGGPPGSPDAEGDRYIEIWNLVFMQYDRDSQGQLTPLPKPSVDTGMGLERVAAILQHKHNNYDIDLFQELIATILKFTPIKEIKPSHRVIADHLRSAAFLAMDGVTPSNEGRGYVQRRIIRRALRHGYQLGVREAFFYRLVPALIKVMGDAYPELKEREALVTDVLREEEAQFSRTLEQGMKIFAEVTQHLKEKIIPGEIVFRLYDTYGFPVDLTNDIAREQGLTLDMQGFETCMEMQRQRARDAKQFKMEGIFNLKLPYQTPFTGYDTLTQSTEVLAVLSDFKEVNTLSQHQTGILILKASPFYAESGGQVGDKGVITFENNVFEVYDTQKSGDSIVHIGAVTQGHFSAGNPVVARVDETIRKSIMRNHSATHLLHAALRQVLGAHVVQKGSLVEAERLRFDFSHKSALTPEEIHTIEFLVTQHVLQNQAVEIAHCSMEQAKEKGAMALFGEKYGDMVRVLSMNEAFSVELCGGTHVTRTGDIGAFKIVSESAVAAGIRRIEAVTGMDVLSQLQSYENILKQSADKLKVSPEKMVERIDALNAFLKEKDKTISELNQFKLNQTAERYLTEKQYDIHNSVALFCREFSFALDDVKLLADLLKERTQQANLPSVIVFLVKKNDTLQCVCAVSKPLSGTVKAADILLSLGAKGGGRPDFAQGVLQTANIDEVKKRLVEFLNQIKLS